MARLITVHSSGKWVRRDTGMKPSHAVWFGTTVEQVKKNAVEHIEALDHGIRRMKRQKGKAPEHIAMEVDHYERKKAEHRKRLDEPEKFTYWQCASWHGSLALAEKEAARHRHHGYITEITKVEPFQGFKPVDVPTVVISPRGLGSMQ